MQRSHVDTLPRPRSSAVAPYESIGGGWRRTPRWLVFLGFWTLIVLVYSSRQEMRLGPYEWVQVSWLESFKAAVAQWYSWAAMSAGIYWVNRNLPFPPNALLRRLLIHAPLSLVFTVAYAYLNRGVTLLLDAPNDPIWVGGSIVETTTRVIYRLGTFVYWAIAMMCMVIEYQRDVSEREVRSATLERMLVEARLAALRTQLDPHFLFNALNSISAYVESAPRDARLMLEQLGDLLRLSLEHADEQEIPLERELMFVDRYIQLQLVRFSDRLDVRIAVEPEVMGAAVPTFLLQPLIENAMRHGIARLKTAGVIELGARRSGERLHLYVRDNGPGLPAGWVLDEHMGVGLRNTRARLEQLYGQGGFVLTLGPDGGGRTCVEVIIPYHAA